MNLVFSNRKVILIVMVVSLMVSLQMASGKDSEIMKYPYVANAQKEKRILSNYNLLKQCMAKDEVIQLLGQPDKIRNTYDRVKMSEKIGESFVYILKQDSLSGSLNKKNEKLIRVHFDNAGNLQATSALQIPKFRGIKKQRNADLVLIVDPKKKEWKIGEHIEVDVKLYNRGLRSVSVVGPLNHGNIMLLIKLKNGFVVEKIPVQKNAPKLALKDVRIHTEHFLGTTLVLNKKKASLFPGEYTIEAKYLNKTKGKAQDAILGVWTSVPVKIVIID